MKLYRVSLYPPVGDVLPSVEVVWSDGQGKTHKLYWDGTHEQTLCALGEATLPAALFLDCKRTLQRYEAALQRIVTAETHVLW